VLFGVANLQSSGTSPDHEFVAIDVVGKVLVFCFFLFTLEMLTNAYTVRGKSTLKDVERFRKYALFREHMKA